MRLTLSNARRRRRAGARSALLALAVALAGATLVPLDSAHAQRTGGRRAETLKVDDGAAPSVPLPRKARSFSLFAEEDLAMAGMKMTGGFGWFFPNVGPCPYYFEFNTEVCGLTRLADNTIADPYFTMDLMAGAPISDFRKIRAVYPGIANMKPPVGYTAIYTEYLASPAARGFGAADGQNGVLFSGGVVTKNDGSCTDNSDFLSGRVAEGVTMLAASDCPQTWPATGFGGLRPVLDSARVQAFQASPNTFKFDDFRLPAAAFDTTQFLGTFSTYGRFSDHYREILQRYGSVTPKGTGAPQERGYPLGLDIRFDAFQFGRPSISNVVFWQLTVVNRSADVYGRGVDYDSLYMGLKPGYLWNGTQSGSAYQDMQRNAWIVTGGNTSGKCSATFPRRTSAGLAGCPVGAINAYDAFDYSGQVILVLKSPLGDTRNKLLTDPTSKYYNPTSPFADDTITYNHGARSAFGQTYDQTYGQSLRSVFGNMSSTEDNLLDNRPLSTFTNARIYTLFQNESYNGLNTPDVARFNRFVPGATAGYGRWDYNNDGVQDTIYVAGCGSRGCATVYSDTTAAGLSNTVGNVGNVMSSGPFALKAGDTTVFIYAFLGAPDSLSLESQINGAIRSYMNNFAGPSPYPAPTFTNNDVTVTPSALASGTSATSLSEAKVRIRINQIPRFDDPFLATLLTRLETGADENARRLVRLNPDLIEAVRGRVHSNFADLLVFKSCDKGRTFTVSRISNGVDRCLPARVRDVTGANIGFGWQPYEIIKTDTATGLLERPVFEDDVLAGRTYLYSFVARTRGVIDIPVVDSTATGLVATNLAKALSFDADSVASPLARSGPTTVTVYAPISLTAGSQLANFTVATASGAATQNLKIEARPNVLSGTYRVIFANRFILSTARDTVSGTTSSTVVAQRVLTRGTTPTAPTSSFVAGADTLSTSGTVVVSPEFTPTRRGVSGRNVVTVDTLGLISGSIGYLLARDSAGVTRPYYVSRDSASQDPAIFEASHDFPGITVSTLAEVSGSSQLRNNAAPTVTGKGDTLDATVVSNNGVTLQNRGATRVNSPGGVYTINWGSDAYGPGSPFRLAQAPELTPVVVKSLTDRPVLTTGSTSANLLAQIGAGRPLVAAKIPFDVTLPSGQKAVLAMRQRHTSAVDSVVANSILLGTAGDTVRVSVPPDLWVPGDQLYVFEKITRDSSVLVGSTRAFVIDTDSVTTLANGRKVVRPLQVTRDSLLALNLLLNCNSTTTPVTTLTPRCNPIALTTRGASGYLPFAAGYKTVLDFPRQFDLFSEVRINATGQGPRATVLTNADLSKIRVVPNPYIVQSQYDEVSAARVGTSRILFTNVPEQGVLRIYTMSGQFIQQLTWTAADLTTTGSTGSNGDLPYNLRTREGLELGSGLYLYTISATGSTGKGKMVRGKFVIIR